MSNSQQLAQHLIDLGLAVDQLLVQLPNNLTLSSEDGVLCLYDRENPQSKLKVDFLNGPLSYRSQQHLGAENLIKACQIKGQNQLSLLDGTCGLGSDSFLLHQAGFQITAVEKNAITHALLLDGISRYHEDTDKGCFKLIFGDVLEHMLEKQYDVIYLDPMFPNKQKSAKNKKTMQLFQAIHESKTDDAAQLLDWAMSSSCKRVVIKRPSKSPIMTNVKPTFQVVGKTCRFDAYQLK